MNINLSKDSNLPLYEQVKLYIEDKIYNKVLVKGDMLPSIRTLSKELQIGVITTKRAYTELVNDGLIISKEGVGFFVSNINIEDMKKMKEDNIIKSVEVIVLEAKNENIDIERIKKVVNDIYGR